MLQQNHFRIDNTNISAADLNNMGEEEMPIY